MPNPAADFVSALPFNRHVGVEVGDDAYALGDFPHLKNHVGTMHAGALFTLGEGASGVAVLSALSGVLGGAVPVAKAAVLVILVSPAACRQ